jgi:hypothetical protein
MYTKGSSFGLRSYFLWIETLQLHCTFCVMTEAALIAYTFLRKHVNNVYIHFA